MLFVREETTQPFSSVFSTKYPFTPWSWVGGDFFWHLDLHSEIPVTGVQQLGFLMVIGCRGDVKRQPPQYLGVHVCIETVLYNPQIEADFPAV
ncbi:hypothetical protein TNCV_1939631 [Trichonephila clavipes]|nr:hypothetical protein TNCV_1939631 [Trichonephila clavipes]